MAPLPDGDTSGLRVTAFELGTDVPRFVPADALDVTGSQIGLRFEDVASGGTLVYAPGVSNIGTALQTAADGADCLLIDGTFWSDDEPQRAGICNSTARRMGHVPVSGRKGTLEWLANMPVQHRVYVHINNTNPMLNEAGDEWRQVNACGVRVGNDGDAFEI